MYSMCCIFDFMNWLLLGEGGTDSQENQALYSLGNENGYQEEMVEGPKMDIAKHSPDENKIGIDDAQQLSEQAPEMLNNELARCDHQTGSIRQPYNKNRQEEPSKGEFQKHQYLSVEEISRLLGDPSSGMQHAIYRPQSKVEGKKWVLRGDHLEEVDMFLDPVMKFNDCQDIFNQPLVSL